MRLVNYFPILIHKNSICYYQSMQIAQSSLLWNNPVDAAEDFSLSMICRSSRLLFQSMKKQQPFWLLTESCVKKTIEKRRFS